MPAPDPNVIDRRRRWLHLVQATRRSFRIVAVRGKVWNEVRNREARAKAIAMNISRGN